MSTQAELDAAGAFWAWRRAQILADAALDHYLRMSERARADDAPADPKVLDALIAAIGPPEPS